MVTHISKLVYKVTKGSFTKVIAGYVFVTFILGRFIPSITALFVLVWAIFFTPVLPPKSRSSPSRC